MSKNAIDGRRDLHAKELEDTLDDIMRHVGSYAFSPFSSGTARYHTFGGMQMSLYATPDRVSRWAPHAEIRMPTMEHYPEVGIN